MIKTTEFYDYLCTKLGYRIFSGVPVKNFDYIYKYMNPAFMHYIPATSESVAVGMIVGINFGGGKGVSLIDAQVFDQLYEYIKCIADLFTGNALFITNGPVHKNIIQVQLSNEQSLANVGEVLTTKSCCLVINKGILSDG